MTEPRASLRRALEVLDVLTERPSVGVVEIAEVLQVHRTTATRLLRTLERHALVERTDDQAYRLGVGVTRLAMAGAARLGLVRCAHPLAQELARETGATVEVVVLAGATAMCVDHLAPRGQAGWEVTVGHRRPLATSCLGAVLGSDVPAVGYLVDPALAEVAAPIRGADGRVSAALSLSGPRFRLDRDRVEVVAPRVVRAAADISAQLSRVA